MAIYEDIDPAFLSTALRALITQPAEDNAINNRLTLANWFPINPTFVEGIDWSLTDKATLRTYTEAMPARAFDTTARIKGREGWQKKTGQMAAFGESYVVTEEDMVYQAAATANDAEQAAALSEVFDDLNRGVRAFMARMELIYGELIRLGTTTIAENGVQPTAANYGRNASMTHTVSTAWSDSANADPFGEERIALDTYETEQDMTADDLVVLTTQATYREWADTTAVKNSHPSFRVQTEIADEDLQALRARHGLPPIVLYDKSIRGVGSGSASKVFPDGDWIYVPRNLPLGSTQLGTPPAARMPGLEVARAAGNGPLAYIEYETNPAQMSTVLDLVGMPILFDTNATYRMVV